MFEDVTLKYFSLTKNFGLFDWIALQNFVARIRENSELFQSSPNLSLDSISLPGISKSASQALVIEIQHAPLLTLPVEKRTDDASQSLRVGSSEQ